MADEQKNVNQPQQGGIRASSFFAAEQKRKEAPSTATVKASADVLGREEQDKKNQQKSLSRRMEEAYDSIVLDKAIKRKLGVIVLEMETVKNNLVQVQKQVQAQVDGFKKYDGNEKRREKTEKDELRRVRSALFDLRGTLAAWSGVNLLEALKSGDIGQAGANLGGMLTLLAPEIFNIVSNTVTGILIGYGLIRGGGKNVESKPPKSTPNVPGMGKLGFIPKAIGILSLLGGGAFLANQMSKKDDLEERLNKLSADQKTVVSGLPESEIERFNNILTKFEQAVDRLIGPRKPTVPIPTEDTTPPGPGLGAPGSPYPDNKVPEFDKDVEFLQKVRLMSQKLNIKPSELLSMLSKESGESINPKSKADSGATGIFQLMFNPKDASQKRYGYTREEFIGLSRAQQMDVFDQYMQDVQKQFKIYPQSTLDLGLSQLAPALMGAEQDTTVYKQGSAAYEGNKGIDTNEDGKITAGEIQDFMMSNVEKFKHYDQQLLDFNQFRSYVEDTQKSLASTTFLPLDLSAAPASPGPNAPLVTANNEAEYYSTSNPHTHLALFYQTQYNLMEA